MQQAGWRWRLQEHRRCQVDRSHEVYITAACSRLSPALSCCPSLAVKPAGLCSLMTRFWRSGSMTTSQIVRPRGDQTHHSAILLTELMFWFHPFHFFQSVGTVQRINLVFISSVSEFTEHFWILMHPETDRSRRAVRSRLRFLWLFFPF